VLLIAEDDGSDPSDRAFTDLVGAGRVDGLMVASAREGSSIASQLRATGVPHVFVNRSSAGSGRNVTMDVAAASTAAVSHLAELGHSRIGHIAGPRGVTSARERESGFRAAARRQAVARSPVCRGAFSEAGGYEATGVIVRRHPDLTALYASTLPQAIGALHALRHLGRSVPDDISVVSFDDLPLAEYLDPPLTCISMPLVELGTMAVNALIGQLEGAAPCDVVVPTHPVMVVRSSSGPPRP
jgi:LacI family transcriptional regulator